MNENLFLRFAEFADAKLLLQWRNDEKTRSLSHNTGIITLEQHISWLKKVLSDSNRKLFVAEENGTPVGTVRADFDENIWELSWTVAPAFRGRGVAKAMVSLLASQISEPIRAEVKSGNIASVKVAENAGMSFEREEKGILHFMRGSLQ